MPIRCKKCGRWMNKNEHTCPKHNPMQGVHRFGEEATNWNGGEIIIEGYKYIYSPNHPNKILGNYVKESRLVMEKKIKRFLNRNEIVHHRNENKLDNNINNLEIVTIAEHNKIHKTKEKLI